MESAGLVQDLSRLCFEPVRVQPKWIAGGAFQFDCEFYKFTRARNLFKQDGIILRHLLRLVILAGEFLARTEDPDYQQIVELTTKVCERVDRQYTERFLSDAEKIKEMAKI